MQVEYKLLLIELHIMKSLQVDNTVSFSPVILTRYSQVYCFMYKSIAIYCFDTCFGDRKCVRPAAFQHLMFC